MKKGFTLLELLVTMAVISVMATVLIVIINPVETARRGRDSKRISELGTIKSSIDLALADRQSAPVTTNGNWINLSTSSSANLDGNGLDISKYMPVLSKDPGGTSVHVEADCASHIDTASKKYEYKSNGSVYLIRAMMESKTNCDQIKNDGLSDNYYELGTVPSPFTGF